MDCSVFQLQNDSVDVYIDGGVAEAPAEEGSVQYVLNQRKQYDRLRQAFILGCTQRRLNVAQRALYYQALARHFNIGGDDEEEYDDEEYDIDDIEYQLEDQYDVDNVEDADDVHINHNDKDNNNTSSTSLSSSGSAGFQLGDSQQHTLDMDRDEDVVVAQSLEDDVLMQERVDDGDTEVKTPENVDTQQEIQEEPPTTTTSTTETTKTQDEENVHTSPVARRPMMTRQRSLANQMTKKNVPVMTPVKKKAKTAATSKRNVQTLQCDHCGDTSSRYWTTGPNGPRTLCKGCGVKWAEKVAAAAKSPPPTPAVSKPSTSTGKKPAAAIKKAVAKKPAAATRGGSRKKAEEVPEPKEMPTPLNRFKAVLQSASRELAKSRGIRMNLAAHDKENGNISTSLADQQSWTSDEIDKLNAAKKKVKPTDYHHYWDKIAQMVGTKTAEQCQQQSNSIFLTPNKNKKRKKDDEEEEEEDNGKTEISPIKLDSRSLNTLKTKRKIREFILEQTKSKKTNDIVNTTPFKRTYKQFVPSTYLNDSLEEDDLFNPQASSSKTSKASKKATSTTSTSSTTSSSSSSTSTNPPITPIKINQGKWDSYIQSLSTQINKEKNLKVKMANELSGATSMIKPRQGNSKPTFAEQKKSMDIVKKITMDYRRKQEQIDNPDESDPDYYYDEDEANTSSDML
ncbi:hypothetical protein SAMD00019534_092190 [Acytostelium subglobosum LB1]|uniref:hypothetical protein n=1 Tax=Acytostelium subglobosum LB1 TaxID=1410327 RepID=UPI000644E000|nr:hypothetical protein SAMD00019534_092190 [Acytostelium subglobosum LB1]GAM26044.1 hypothetical protein SAMD00019534_092190 [Acytostelium subglobosum LB1]|eukprot:XP_012751087.1 hypothetical protein SAMD00019534_092190 [Acytostelium subglobosum LB1]